MSEVRDFPFVAGDSIGDAWFEALDRVIAGNLPNRYLTIHITNPITRTDDLPETTDLTEWEDVLNLGDVYEDYTQFDFGQKTDYGGKIGYEWIDSRIYELYEGLYRDRLTSDNQLEMIVDRLKLGRHGGCTNALVAQLFDVEKDLTVATSGKPFAKDMSCLTQLQFRPRKNELHLFATFRSQYLDTKCYGNLISLAMLQAQVCAATGYDPGVLVEHVNNTICMDYSTASDLHETLRPVAAPVAS